MSQQRRRRLEALERRVPKGRPYVDPAPVIMRMWDDLQAVVAGRACWRKREPAEMSEEQADAFDRAMAAVDLVAERFEEQRRAAELAKQEAKRQRRAAQRAARAAEAMAAPERAAPPAESAPAPARPVEPTEPMPAVIVPPPRSQVY
jgi:hypothetical protein